MATQQVAHRTGNPVQVFRETLTKTAFREQLKMALPSHVPVERFIRVAVTAVQNSPSLLDGNKVDQNSLFGALVKAAQDGLLPDGRQGAIVPYKGKAMWQPMVAGIMLKVRQSGEIANWDVAAVYEKDKFQRLLGDDQRLYHEPYEDGDPGQVIGAYSIVTFKDGTKSRDYMPRWRIEKARAQGSAKDSLMWSQFYDEGAIKTVIKHHAKRLPMATDIDAIIDASEPESVKGFQPQIVESADEPASRLDALEYTIEERDDPPHDASAPEGGATETVTPEDELPVWFPKVEALRANIANAKTRADYTAANKDFERLSAGLPDEVYDELNDALAALEKGTRDV